MANEYYQSPKQLAMIDRENRISTAYQKITTHCKCGHSFIIPTKVDRLICSYCGNFAYRTEELEKKYKDKETLMKLKKYLKESNENVDRVDRRYLGVQPNTKHSKKGWTKKNDKRNK